MILRCRQFTFTFPRPALVMGVVNVTPDSFSDGGKFLDAGQAVAHGLELVAQGAEILDVGGESTRPGATPVTEAEELRRVIPVIEKLAAEVNVLLSIDTIKPAVARAARESERLRQKSLAGEDQRMPAAPISVHEKSDGGSPPGGLFRPSALLRIQT